MSKVKVDSYLFEEVPGNGRRVRFRYPSRLMRYTAAERLALSSLALVGISAFLKITLAHWGVKTLAWILLILSAHSAFRWMRTIWSRRDVIADLDIEVVQVVERSLFRSHVRNLPFAGFMGVTLIAFEDHTWAVALRHANGQHVWLGMANVLVPVENLADRFVKLTRLPLLAIKAPELPDEVAAEMAASIDGTNRSKSS